MRGIEGVPVAARAHAALGQVAEGVDVETVLRVGLEASDGSAHYDGIVGGFGLDEHNAAADAGVFAVCGRGAEDCNGGVGCERRMSE